MVNETMQQAYERALVRAHKDQLVVTLLESEMAHVFNPAHDGYYTVRFPKGARQMTCNCEAGQLGNYCKHRAIVREQLVERAAAKKALNAPSLGERDVWNNYATPLDGQRVTDASWREAYAQIALQPYL